MRRTRLVRAIPTFPQADSLYLWHIGYKRTLLSICGKLFPNILVLCIRKRFAASYGKFFHIYRQSANRHFRIAHETGYLPDTSNNHPAHVYGC